MPGPETRQNARHSPAAAGLSLNQIIFLFHLSDSLLYFRGEIQNFSGVCLIHIPGCKHEIRSSKIIGYRNIIYDRNSKKRLDIRIMRLCFQRIPQKDHKVNATFYDLCSNLLIPSEGTALLALYARTGSPVFSAISPAVVPVPQRK